MVRSIIRLTLWGNSMIRSIIRLPQEKVKEKKEDLVGRGGSLWSHVSSDGQRRKYVVRSIIRLADEEVCC